MPDLDPIDPPAHPEFDLDPTANEVESTTGTGSVLAIGCSVLVLLVLFIGIAVFISRQVN